MSSDPADFLKTLFDSQQWTIIVIVGTLAAIASAIFDFFGFRLFLQQRRTQKLLERSFGSEFFGPETIERSTRYYVPPNCSSVDPAQEVELRRVMPTEEKLFEKIDKYLTKDESGRHLLLLADSGMGKSSFVLNCYGRNQRLPKRKRQRLAVVPLGIPDADDYIAKIEDQPNTVIFLDAFDEDTKAIRDHRQRLLELMHGCRKFKRVLITCRTQFFPSAEEIPRETGIARVGPRKAGEEAKYEFWKLYLSPLDDEQVEAFLRKRYRWPFGKRKQARELVKKIPLLSVRPMLLAYIPDLLESGAKIEYAFQLYEVLVEKWLERESAWVKPEALRQFSERLAVDLYGNRERRGAERIPRAELVELAKAWSISLDDWQLSGRSLLNRDAEGNYKFAHRSIMEYLVGKRLIDGDTACDGLAPSDQMSAFVREMIPQYFAENKPVSKQVKPFVWEMIPQYLAEKKPVLKQMKPFIWEMVQHYLAAKKPIPFDATTCDLSEFQLRLRSKPILNLKEEDVRAMLTEHEFFDTYQHKAGKGIAHLYELREKVVIDHTTGSMWQQSGSTNYMKYADVEKYIRDLNNQRFAGYHDWRLPTLEEAMSLMEPNPQDGLYLDSVFDRKQRWIWTADKESAGRAWYVGFGGGRCYRLGVDGGHDVRAVRS